MRLITFRNSRIFVLLGVLIFTTAVTLHQLVYTRSWTKPLSVVILPINGDRNLATHDYIESLTDRHFKEINHWFEREAKRYDLALSKPVDVMLGPQVKSQPPVFPENAHALNVVIWGLRFRWWAFRNTPDIDNDLTLVRIFVRYYTGEDNQVLQHSLGMQKGLLGLVHAFALPQQTAQNNIVIAHELLHTVGAIDKYEFNGSPVFPIGYANPNRSPLHPQRSAEIMAGRIPLSMYQYYMAESLKSVIINHYTAAEINWLE